MKEKDYLEPAGVFRRLIAWLIDACVLLGLVEFFLFFALNGETSLINILELAGEKIQIYGIFDLGLPWMAEVPIHFLTFASLLALVLLVGFFYSTIAECSANGGTLGKILTGIRVVNSDSNRISFISSVVRNFVKIFSVLTCGLGLLIAWLNYDRQSFHDFLSSTFVVKSSRSGLLQILISFIFSVILFAFVSLLLFRFQVEEVTKSKEVISKKIEEKGGIENFAKSIVGDEDFTPSRSGFPVQFETLDFNGVGKLIFKDENIYLEQVLVKYRNLIKERVLSPDKENFSAATALEIYLFDYELSDSTKKQLYQSANLKRIFGKSISKFPVAIIKINYPLTESLCYPELITKSSVLIRRKNTQFILDGEGDYILFDFDPNSLRLRGLFASQCLKLEQGEKLKSSFRFSVDVGSDDNYRALLIADFNEKMR